MIRKAEIKDIEAVNNLLRQVLMLHLLPRIQDVTT